MSERVSPHALFRAGSCPPDTVPWSLFLRMQTYTAGRALHQLLQNRFETATGGGRERRGWLIQTRRLPSHREEQKKSLTGKVLDWTRGPACQGSPNTRCRSSSG